MKNDIIAETQFESERARKTWQTPLVILGALEQAEFNVGLTDDGDGGATTGNSYRAALRRDTGLPGRLPEPSMQPRLRSCSFRPVFLLG